MQNFPNQKYVGEEAEVDKKTTCRLQNENYNNMKPRITDVNVTNYASIGQEMDPIFNFWQLVSCIHVAFQVIEEMLCTQLFLKG